MLNEEKISLMTKLALYEQKEGRKQIPMSGYYKGDYVSLNVLNSVIIGTIAYLLIIGTIILINAESLVEKLTEIDLIATGKQILTYYLIFIVCYIVVAYIFYRWKFKAVRVKLNQYNADLKQLYEMYKNEPGSKEAVSKKEVTPKKEAVSRKETVSRREAVSGKKVVSKKKEETPSYDDDLNDILELIEEDN